MATGFMGANRALNQLVRKACWLHCSAAGALVLALASLPAEATDVNVVGVFPGKAVLVINGGAPRTLAVGAKSPEGVKLLGVEGDNATLEIDGKRHRLAMGQGFGSGEGGGSRSETTTLTADGRGHFVTMGSINGVPVRFLVDTGATLVSIGAADAVRAGVEYRKGEPGMTMTANGPTQVWRIKLNAVRVGETTLNNVEAAVHAIDLPVALLGMSFLNRMEMNREGSTMTLRKRF
jgi:aspartyl protease family protein